MHIHTCVDKFLYIMNDREVGEETERGRKKARDF